MCGILGSINKSFGKSELSLIKHRGPDDYGIKNYNINNHKIQFGHRRLAIIDLSSAGHQPMFSKCEDYAIIFNGEVYNHLALRDKLSKDIKYEGHSDTETILYYLMYFGLDGLKDFNGIFALAFLDKKNQSLSIARDPFGVKPLYYSQGLNSLTFSSELRPIKKLTSDLNMDKNALASLLRLRYNPSPETLFTSIKKVKPGHYLSFNLKEEKMSFSDVNYGVFPVERNKNIDKVTAVAKYGELLEQAIKRQLLSDVEVGVLLSGGIDSAIVAYFAKKHYRGNLKAFTIGFEGLYDVDEINYATQTAQLLGLEHYVKKITFSNFLDLIEKCTNIVEEPLATTSIIPMYYLSELASKSVKVVLTGQGADEPLGGYGRYKAELIRDKTPKALRPFIKSLVNISNTKKEQLLRGAKSININDKVERFLTTYEVFTVSEIENLIGESDYKSREKITYMLELLESKNKSTVEDMMSIDSRLNLSDDLLNYTDKITMNFSIECRVPMLDLNLIQYIESLPTDMKLNVKSGKIIHKEFAKSILPDEIINRPKKGFQSPTKEWFKVEVNTLKTILLNEDNIFSKVFNIQYVAKILDQHCNGFNKEKQIFLLLSLYYWLNSNKEIISI